MSCEMKKKMYYQSRPPVCEVNNADQKRAKSLSVLFNTSVSLQAPPPFTRAHTHTHISTYEPHTHTQSTNQTITQHHVRTCPMLSFNESRKPFFFSLGTATVVVLAAAATSGGISGSNDPVRYGWE